jgi:hypothetical protein
MEERDDAPEPATNSMTHSHSHHRTPRGLALAPLIAVSALVALVPQRAAAQSESAECLAIVSQMRQPSPAPDAIRASAGCPLSGPTMLAQRWSRRGARSAMERAALVDASSRIRDGRVYEAVSGVVSGDLHPIADRLAGVRVLVEYAEQGFTVSQQGQSLEPRTIVTRQPRHTDAPTAIAGSVALPLSVRMEVRRELSRLALTDHDPEMRLMAQRANEKLGYVIPKGARVGVIRRS